MLLVVLELFAFTTIIRLESIQTLSFAAQSTFANDWIVLV